MKRVLKLSAWSLLLAGLMALGGCVEESPYPPPPGPVAYYDYWYYPDVEVYYLPGRHMYYWRDGGQWRSGPRAPAGVTLDAHVGVRLDTPEPYSHHEEIRARYPARAGNGAPARGPDGHF